MSAKGHNGHGHVTETPDVSHIMNPDVTHEMSDVNIIAVLKFIGALTLMTIAVFGLMLFLFNMLNMQVSKRDQKTPPGPMARTEQERLPPEPRLQEAPGFGVKLENGQVISLDAKNAPANPQAEYRVLRQQWDMVLQTGKAHESDTSAALPIDQAMKRLLESNSLRVRPPMEGNSNGTIGAPTAASSGRMSVKRTQ